MRETSKSVDELGFIPSGDSAKAAESIMSAVFEDERWLDDLQRTMAPEIAETVIRGAAAEMLLTSAALGLEPAKETTAEAIAARLQYDIPDDIAIGQLPEWMREAARDAVADTFARDYWTNIVQTTRDDISRTIIRSIDDGLSIRKTAKAIAAAHGGDYNLMRGTRVARTEVPDALNAGHSAGIDQIEKESGLKIGKEWVSVLGNTTRASHAALDGVEVPSAGKFLLGGVEVPWPAHGSLPAGERISCQCTIVSTFIIEPEPEDKPEAKPKPGGPPSLESLTDTGVQLGGSTGARLMRDEDGNKFVVKRSRDFDKMSEEHLADTLYDAMGVKVPEGWLQQEGDELVKISKFLDKSEELPKGELLRTARSLKEKIQKDFAADALLGNWDVAGLDMDNILVRRGVPYRIDNGGALSFRAMGDPKGDKFTNNVLEMWTLSDENMNSSAANLFGGMTIQDKSQAAGRLLKKEKKFWTAFDKWETQHGITKSQLRKKMEKRWDSMRNFHITTDDMLVDKWVGDYVNDLAKHEMQMDEAGIFERLPEKLVRPKGGDSYKLVDEDGVPFDHLRGDIRGVDGELTVVEKLARYMSANDGDMDIIQAWSSDQSSSSWRSEPVKLKWFMANQRSVPTDSFFWNKTDPANLARQWDNLNDNQKKRFTETWKAQHIYTQRFLRSVDFKNNNRKQRVVNLARTEDGVVMRKHNMERGDFSAIERGAAESFSLVKQVVVNGTQLTYQEMPHTRIFATYFHGNRGQRNTMFLSDEENEFIAMGEGVPAFYAGSSNGRSPVESASSWKKKIKPKP